MTLIIIKRLRLRLNMHIIMAYLAISDIIVLATLVAGIYPNAMEINLISFKSYWKTYCIVTMFFNMVGYTGSLLTYFLLSIDRYVLISIVFKITVKFLSRTEKVRNSSSGAWKNLITNDLMTINRISIGRMAHKILHYFIFATNLLAYTW